MYKVLIIDDEPWARTVVKSLGNWESLALKIIDEAEDGTEGIRLIGELKPHIVITDMRMPGLEGVELLKAINEQFPMVKLIVMSGYDDFQYLKQAIRSRAAEYLLKPIDPVEFNDALARCVKELEEAYKDSSNTWVIPVEDIDKSRTKLDISDIENYILKHFREDISLETIAQHFFVSKEYLSRAFKSSTGENISDYIVRIRMEKAKELILEHKLSIKYAAENTGYYDLSYFYRVFKKYFGITPAELKKNVNKVQ